MDKTNDNLMAALQGESMARNKYRAWAGAARKEGHFAIGKIFEETAENEYEHASRIMAILGIKKSTKENLKAAAEGETHEWLEMYPGFEEVARKEGKADAMQFFGHVKDAENLHRQRYENLLKLLNAGRLYKSDKEEYWFCTNCGYMHKGKEAPAKCPNCLHEQGYFIRKCLLEYGEK